MSKFINRFTRNSVSSERQQQQPKDPKRSLSVNTTSSDPLTLDSSSLNAKPIVKSPDWSVMYDPTLSVYYYVNDRTNESQFDHPDEVVSPTASPVLQHSDSPMSYDTDHRKIFSTSLKRTFSPKFFSSSNNHNDNKSRSASPRSASPRTSIEQSNIPKSSYSNSNDQDEDVEEFRKQLEMEMKSYECERLRSV